MGRRGKDAKKGVNLATRNEKATHIVLQQHDDDHAAERWPLRMGGKNEKISCTITRMPAMFPFYLFFTSTALRGREWYWTSVNSSQAKVLSKKNRKARK